MWFLNENIKKERTVIGLETVGVRYRQNVINQYINRDNSDRNQTKKMAKKITLKKRKEE